MNKEESLSSLTLAFVIMQSFIINEGAFVTSYFSYQVKQSVWTYTDIDTNMYIYLLLFFLLFSFLLQIRCVILIVSFFVLFFVCLFVCLVFCWLFDINFLLLIVHTNCWHVVSRISKTSLIRKDWIKKGRRRRSFLLYFDASEQFCFKFLLRSSDMQSNLKGTIVCTNLFRTLCMHVICFWLFKVRLLTNSVN